MMDLMKLFKDINQQPVFAPWQLRWSDKKQKYLKVPINGRSTKEPEHWTPLQAALDEVAGFNAICANKKDHLRGVGLATTWEIARGTDEVLVGFDFDGVDFTKFIPPFASYWEKSPSGKGLRALAWAPREWAARFKDSLNVQYPNCHHCEIYVGTTPRFLTVTGDWMVPKAKTHWTGVYCDIKSLRASALEKIAKWEGFNKADDPRRADPDAPEIGEGKAMGLLVVKHSLPDKQRLLLEGKLPVGERSGPFHGLLLELMGRGHTDADILATLLGNEVLWAYLCSKREGADNAAQFARDEVKRARDRYNEKHPPTPIRVVPADDEPAAVKVAPADDKPATSEPAPAPASAFPQHLFDEAPGLVGEIARWILQASYRPRKEFALACALLAVSCLMGPHVRFGPKKTKCNVYIVLVGGTGDGKNEAADSAALLLETTDAKDCLSDFPASEAALRRQLNVNPNILIRVDEFAHKMACLLGTGNSNGTGMLKAILDAFNGTRMPPKSYADGKKDLPAVEDPYVQILGMSTDKVWEVLRPEHLEDGTLNRFLFVCLPDDAGYVCNPTLSTEVPKALKDRLNAFFRQGRKLDLIGDAQGPGRSVVFDEDVRQALDTLDRETYEGHRGTEYAPLYARDVLYVSKVAAILAVGDGRQQVSMEDYTQALLFVGWCRANAQDQISRKMADNEVGKLINKALAVLEEEGGKTTRRQLCRRMTMHAGDVDKLIDTLVVSGRVWMEEVTRKGSPSLVIHLGEQPD